MKHILPLAILLFFAILVWQADWFPSTPDFQLVSSGEVSEHPTQLKQKKTPEERALFALERAQFEFDLQKDPNTGSIPENIRERELAQAYRAPLLDKSSRGTGVTVEARGPNNLGGRTRAIEFDVRDVQIILSGGVSSGVFKTTNGGASWTKTSANSDIHNVTAIVQDPRTGFEDTWYYATGEPIGNSTSLGSLYHGSGIWKSTDNGDSWTFLGKSNRGALESFDSRMDFITNLVVDPTTGYVYAAGLGQIIRSTDGGASWASVLSDPAFSWSTSQMTDLQVTSGGRFYAGFSGTTPSGFDGVWTSTDGTTWARIAGDGVAGTPAGWDANGSYGRVVLSVAPSDETVLFVLFANFTSNTCAPGVVEADLYRAKFDGVSTWSWVDLSGDLPDEAGCSTGNDPFSVQGGYDLEVSVKPDDENVFFIGGTNAYRMDYVPATTSATAARIGGYLNGFGYTPWPGHHSDIHVLTFKPGDPDTLFSGSDGGIHKTALSAISWINLNNDYVTYQEYHVAIDPTTGSDLILAGAQDNGSHESLSGTTHSSVYSGDGVAVAINSVGDYFLGSQRGNLRRRDFGAAFTTNIKPSGSGSGIFVTYFYLDPDNSEYLYYADDDDLYRATSASTASTVSGWTLMTGIGATLVGDIRSMATSRGSGYGSSDASRKLYLGTNDGQVYVLADPAFAAAATAPTSITPPGASGSATVSGIAVDPTDDDRVLVTYSNYGISSVYFTDDGGTSWSEVEGNIPLPSFRSAAIMNLDAASTLYFVGTSVGLFCTKTLSGATTTWNRVSPDDMGYAVVSGLRLRVSDNVMVAGTHGNGNFIVEPPRTPEISFVQASAETQELAVSSISCREYREISVDLQIAKVVTGDAIVTLSAAGSATDVSDFDIMNDMDTVIFRSGSNGNRPVTIRIYDDSNPEADESVILTYGISGTTDAVAGPENQSYTLTIADNDEDPALLTEVIWTEDWEAAAVGWLASAVTAPANIWFITSSCTPVSGTSAQIITDDGAGGLFCGYENTVATTQELYKSVDATGLSSIEVSFDYLCEGEGSTIAPIDFGIVVFSTDGGTSWTPIGTPLVGETSATTATVSLPAILDDAIFLLGWRWTNDGSSGSSPSMSLDNIVVTGKAPAPVKSSLTASAVSEYLGPFETAFFYDGGELICKIANTSSHDYGCTSVSIDRVGTGATDFWYTGAGTDGKDIADKTILVTPTTNSPTGSYTITLYYTETELLGWEAATGKTVSADLQMAKNGGAIANVTPLSQYPDGAIDIDSISLSTAFLGTGTEQGISGSFSTGFSGFGIGDPGPPPPSLPVEWLSISAKEMAGNVKLDWATASESNTDRFEIERKTSNEGFVLIGSVEAVGFSQDVQAYTFLDQAAPLGRLLYRLKQIDQNGEASHSRIVSVQLSGSIRVQLGPNPFSESLHLHAELGDDPTIKDLHFRLLDTRGKLVYEQRFAQTGSWEQDLPLPELAAGIYLYEWTAGTHRQSGKLMKQ